METNTKAAYQKTFNFAAAHLLNMETQSRGLGNINGSIYGLHPNGCAYRSVNGCKCAIGAFIPDPMYDRAMEGQTVDTILRAYPLFNEYMQRHFVNDEYFLEQLQNIHDLNFFAKDFYLQELAATYGLEWQPELYTAPLALPFEPAY